jgi:hypothetical protein
MKLHDPNDTGQRAPFDGAFSRAARKEPVENVIIEVGPSLIQYHLPKPILTHYSDYFEAALSGPWKESNGTPIKLDDVSPAIFNLFVNWLFRQKVPDWNNQWVAEAENADAIEVIKYNTPRMLKIMLYCFADRFLVSALYRQMNRLLPDKPNGRGPFLADEIAYAYENLPVTDPVLDLMVDTYMRKSEASEEQRKEELQWENKLPREFLARVARKLREGLDKGGMEGKLDACDYHGHVTRKQRRRCKDKEGRLGLMEHLLLTI